MNNQGRRKKRCPRPCDERPIRSSMAGVFKLGSGDPTGVQRVLGSL